jgi:hypothetical protein
MEPIQDDSYIFKDICTPERGIDCKTLIARQLEGEHKR